MWESIFTKPFVKRGLLPSAIYWRYLSFVKLYPFVLSFVLTGVAALLNGLSLRDSGSKRQEDRVHAKKIE